MYWARVKLDWLSRRRWLQRAALWIGAVAVAVLAWGFAELSERANALFHQALALQPALAFVIVPAGLALVVALTRRFFPTAQGSGIPQSIAALDLPSEHRHTVLSLRIALAKIGLTALGLAAGASVGREGPTVQVGASVMMRIGTRLRLPINERSMILAGGAAGVAAAFNTPLAGVVFAIEELSRSYEVRTSGTVFTAVILAGIASLALVGNSPYFGHAEVTLDLGRAWLAVGVVGLSGGVLGGLFAQALVLSSRHGLPGRAGAFASARPVAFAALCGVVLAAIGIASGNLTYGTGYGEARSALEGGSLPASYFPLKMLASVVSYVSGIPGGIFSPSLSAGAGMGQFLSSWLPGTPTKACILLGMAAYFTGVVQTPITAVVIVMEMTDNQTMTIPLMAACIVAFAVSRLVCPHPLYKVLAEKFTARANRSQEGEVRTDLADPVDGSRRD